MNPILHVVSPAGSHYHRGLAPELLSQAVDQDLSPQFSPQEQRKKIL